MRQVVFLAAVALCGSSPAAAQLMSSTQSFYVSYVNHGSTGPQEINLYDGPFVLHSVTIDWHADIVSFFNNPDGDDTPYNQSYSGRVGFFMYNEDGQSTANGVSAFKDFSGSTTCSFAGCGVEGSASETLFASPSAFEGSGTLIIDSGSYIDPIFPYGEYSGVNSDLYGTITYYYGGVPEPASWALMVAGFGLTGGSMRLRASRRGEARASRA